MNTLIRPRFDNICCRIDDPVREKDSRRTAGVMKEYRRQIEAHAAETTLVVTHFTIRWDLTTISGECVRIFIDS
ncbi:hypothetical protein Mal52_13930 [Symmachiella dynata]|uniref:Uncharacterized protein n=1 Tax=Symmachiella dynata TaxID=2527995 RepID=A0A517ZKI1_9PLAN|nr:hypothetical protein Mal52_13930 [Symmachiella dynata]